MSFFNGCVGDREGTHFWTHADDFKVDMTVNKGQDQSLNVVSLSADSVRLVNGTSVCSGRLEVKSNQSDQWWSSVCEDDFDQQDAEVVCRELGCGAPSVLQGALYGAVEAPMWTKEFQCGGNESALLDCRSSGSTRTSCSPGKAVGLTCSGTSGATGWICSFLFESNSLLLLFTLFSVFRACQVGGRSQSLCR